jgi:hypothetical protein
LPCQYQRLLGVADSASQKARSSGEQSSDCRHLPMLCWRGRCLSGAEHACGLTMGHHLQQGLHLQAARTWNRLLDANVCGARDLDIGGDFTRDASGELVWAFALDNAALLFDAPYEVRSAQKLLDIGCDTIDERA